MAITVKQSAEPISFTTGRSPTAEIHYLVSGSTDREAILAALNADASSGLVVDGVPLIRRKFDVVEVEGEIGVWKATANFAGLSAQVEQGQRQESFEIGDDTQHIKNSVIGQPVRSYARPGGTSGLHNGAINVGMDGEVNGIDIELGSFEWSETHVFEASQVNAAYKKKLFNIKQRPVNNAPFRGFAAGEVRYRGTTGAPRADGKWELTFRFAALPNETDGVVGDITGIVKEGWHYSWPEHERAESNGVAVTRVRAVYVEQVYRYSDFSELGIGVAE